MSNDQDALWRAVVTGDEACPDGKSLARLGALMREHAACTASPDFAARVLAASKDAGGADELIDEFYDQDARASVGAADPALAKIRRLARRGAEVPEPVDLLPEVLGNLHRHSARHGNQTVDRVTRLRIWATVIVGHVAAIVTIVVLQGQLIDTDSLIPERPDYAMPSTQEELLIQETQQRIDFEQLDRETSEAMASGLPLRWSQLRGEADTLFLLRQNQHLKDLYRRHYGTDTCKATVQAGLSWLRRQQAENGSFAGPAMGQGSRALATHSVALLALLADGIHGDEQRLHIQRGVTFLKTWFHPEDASFIDDEVNVSSDVAHGMAMLALVESSLLLKDEDLVAFCERALNRNIPSQRYTKAGLDGYFLLAMETANVGELKISANDLAAMRSRARAGSKIEDVGNQGLMALSGFLYGYRDSTRLHEQLEVMSRALPALDEHKRSDPLRWFFPSLAVREAGGESWMQWNRSLQRALLPCFDYNNVDNLAWVSHRKVRFAENDVFATSLVLLNLQTAHRYIPLARSH